MALNHRLNRLEASAPRPRGACPYCGIERLIDGSGPVYPGWVLPDSAEDPSEFTMLGCKSCFAWVKVKGLPNPGADGAYRLQGATPCGPPEYV